MDKMPQTLAKTTVQGMLGAATSGVGLFVDWLTRDSTHALLTNLLLLCFVISAMVAIISAVLRVCYNWHKNRRAASEERLRVIELIRRESILCKNCLLGKEEPGECPVEEKHRPLLCPKELRKKSKVSRLAAWLKFWNLNFKDESTK
jgi:hypothetical protein